MYKIERQYNISIQSIRYYMMVTVYINKEKYNINEQNRNVSSIGAGYESFSQVFNHLNRPPNEEN